MNKLLTVLTFALVLSLGHLLVGCTHSKSIPVQYSAPSDGHYIHGDHCIDGRVF